MSEQKIYITKYALTKGIIEAIAQEISTCDITGHSYAKVRMDGYSHRFYDHDFHLDLESAKDRVKVMIEKRLQSLRAIEKIKLEAEQGRFKVKSLVEEGQ